MPVETKPVRCFHLSASSIAAFKACPRRFQLGYREGLRPIEDTEAQRMGTNWHAMHETYHNALQTCETGGGNAPLDPAQHALDAVLALLNAAYDQMPVSKTAFEWATERQILLTSFVGYLWRWAQDPIKVLASEVGFKLPLTMPRTGLPLSTAEALRVGKIDHLIAWGTMVGPLERKSTSKSIASDSDYWERSQKDTQVSMYALACRDLQTTGQLAHLAPVLSQGDEPLPGFGNTLYDVWHKPTIKPKTLTQADTKAFLDAGTYCGQVFTVAQTAVVTDADGVTPYVKVDGEEVEIEVGKKGYAIRESPAMYGARLLEDIYERPDFYYARREIARTDRDLKKFRGELFNIYQMQKAFDNTGYWFENEAQCRATFGCQYIPICYGGGAEAVCDGTTTPPNFKRIYVDLTVNTSESD